MSVIVLDTDVASSLLRRRTPEATDRQLAGHVLAVTFVTIGDHRPTIGELTKWTHVRRWGPRSLANLRAFLGGLAVLPYDQRVAARWGELQAYVQLRGRPRPINDTWIAACCLVRGLALATSTPGTSPTSPNTRAWRSCPPGSSRGQNMPAYPWALER